MKKNTMRRREGASVGDPGGMGARPSAQAVPVVGLLKLKKRHQGFEAEGGEVAGTKTFPARVILTATTGRLLTCAKGPRDNGIGDLYELLGWMTGDSPMTHQLGRFVEECRPWLVKWFPELGCAGTVKNVARLDELIENAEARGETVEAAIQMWLKWMAERGTAGIQESYHVGRIPRDAHKRKCPLGELVEMRGGETDGIIMVQEVVA